MSVEALQEELEVLLFWSCRQTLKEFRFSSPYIQQNYQVGNLSLIWCHLIPFCQESSERDLHIDVEPDDVEEGVELGLLSIPTCPIHPTLREQ